MWQGSGLASAKSINYLQEFIELEQSMFLDTMRPSSWPTLGGRRSSKENELNLVQFLILSTSTVLKVYGTNYCDL